jgi:hypothetical protein
MELSTKKKLNKFKMVYLPISIISFVLLYVIWYFYFNIYDVNFSVSNYDLYADDNSIAKIEIFPINSFGNRIHLREVEGDFIIEEGKDLVQVIEKHKSSITIKTKNQIGNIKILIKCKYLLFPISIDLIIKPNIA